MAVYLGSEMVNAFSGTPQSLNGENKTAIATALTNKGVTVPDNMGINDIATLIEAIEAGGGSEPYAKIVSGSHTPATNETSITFLPEENLVLRYFILQEEDYANTSGVTNAIRKICVFRGFSQASKLVCASNSNWSMPNYSVSDTNDAILTFPGNSTTTLFLKAGTTFNWIAVYTDI